MRLPNGRARSRESALSRTRASASQEGRRSTSGTSRRHPVMSRMVPTSEGSRIRGRARPTAAARSNARAPSTLRNVTSSRRSAEPRPTIRQGTAGGAASGRGASIASRVAAPRVHAMTTVGHARRFHVRHAAAARAPEREANLDGERTMLRLLVLGALGLLTLVVGFRVLRYATTPLFRRLGIYRYYSPLLLTMPTPRGLQLHLGTSLDFLRAADVSPRTSLRLLNEGLLALCEAVERGEIDKSTVLVGTTYFLRDDTLRRFGF